MIVTVYGIKNCSTVKKALDWLDQHAIAYQFHDYKRAGADEKQLVAWCDELGWERVLNRAGTTFRALPEADRQNLDQGKAVKLMAAQPSMIKRPILDLGSRRLLGFSAELYQQNLQ
jgi:arsenate reductase